MSTFDPTQHPRTQAGVATGGRFTTAPRAEAAVSLEPGQHTPDCLTHAIGCAVQNIRDAKKDTDPSVRDWAAGADPVAVGRGYLEDGSATCHCSSTDMSWATQWTDLGRLALDLHESRRRTLPGLGVDPELAGEGITLPEVSMYRSDMDGTLVVQVDTDAAVGRIRVNLNDGPVWDGDPEADEGPESLARSLADADRRAKLRIRLVARLEEVDRDHDFGSGDVATSDEYADAVLALLDSLTDWTARPRHQHGVRGRAMSAHQRTRTPASRCALSRVR